MRPDITPEYARSLSPKRQQETWILEAEDLIVQAAIEGFYTVKMPYSMWKTWKVDSGGAVDFTKEPCKSFVNHFKNKGFTVTSIYNCLQFVETGIAIDWGE